MIQALFRWCTLMFVSWALAACSSTVLERPVFSPREPLPNELSALTAQAEAGRLDAQFALARRYEVGKGATLDLDQAFKWYGKAANAGHVPAQFFLGAMYASSRGTPLNVPLAIAWYRKAADAGYSDAMYPVAYAYEFGLGGLAQDNALAVKWYRACADRGNVFAHMRLGKAYRSGELGLPVDAERASQAEAMVKMLGTGTTLSMPVGKQ